MKKVKIDIKQLKKEHDKEQVNIESKFNHLYISYCEFEKQYNEELTKIKNEKKELTNKYNNYNRVIEQGKNRISNIYSEKKKQENKQYENLVNEEKLNYNNKIKLLNEELDSANLFTKFIRLFNGYEENELNKFETEYKNNLTNLKNNNYYNIKSIIKNEREEYDNLDEKNRNLLREIKYAEERTTEINNRVNILRSELLKLSAKKAFIKNGDKDKCSEIYSEMYNMYDGELYPSIKRISILQKEAKQLILKYQKNINLLEDNEFNYMTEMINQNILDPNKLKNIFMIKEKYKVKDLLSNIDGKSLDDQQRDSVITNEDNNLVVAGAGSGKTLTISAKVKYLVNRLNVNPKEILLITFTKKAAEEMQERIAKKLGIEVKVKTFHALGYDLLGFFENVKPEIYDDLEKFTNNFINKTVLENQSLRDNIFKYFTTYMNDYVNPEEFDCIGEFYRANKSNSLETIDFKLKKIEANKNAISFNKNIDNIKIWIKDIFEEETVEKAFEKTKELIENIKKQFDKTNNENEKNTFLDIVNEIKSFYKELKIIIENKQNSEKTHLQKLFNEKINKLYTEKRTLKWEKVKSIEELIIANYLFACGIKYVYEGDYKFNTANSKYRQYKPDFYLPEYDIYIEHFGVNEQGRCPQYSKAEEVKYIEGIKWKRELHKKNNTVMEETYSYEHKQGKLIKKLDKIFKEHNIRKKVLTQNEIKNIIKSLNTDNEFKEFYKLLNTFLSLFKSCNYNETNIEKFIAEAKRNSNEYIKEKHTLFLNIFKVYYSEYVKELNEENKIDFNDMINKATNYITSKFLPPDFKFKYIIIDEFQDISVARYKLINAIKKDTGARIMAVGDDWQSIYRFAGSEISIFTKFKEYFGETETLKIEKTYRNSQQLIDIAGKFVMNNPDQIKKDLKSDKRLNKPIILVDYSDNILKSQDEDKNSLVRRIMFILNSFDKTQRTVLLLGRNNFDIKPLTESEFFRVINKDGETIIETNVYSHLNIKYLSVHKSKGLEADEVIIINNKNTLTGFPNKMVSDSVLDYVMTNEEAFMFAEERRLFYVALTRTKNHCYLMCPDEYSNFIEELKDYENIEYFKCDDKEEKINCPICKTGYLVQRTGAQGKLFYSCSNYPQCSFKTSDMTNIKSKVRCPSCGNFMTLKKGPYGEFYGCNSYPNCKTTYSIEEFEKLDKEGGE